MPSVQGATHRKSDKIWRDALMIAAHRTQAETDEVLADAKAPMLARAAAQCAWLAVSGDVAALKELGDRLDGKPKQQVDHEAGETLGEIFLGWLGSRQLTGQAHHGSNGNGHDTVPPEGSI